ncbi:hypothetical protein ACLVWU_02210 [Bdellovibrio sp. HCB290]|uniref:hypothetical protein n=1 Tax=Bdellovibrio sp. HCB290 TaxID=3394356 RepID=UPI0039B5D2C7
MKLLSFAFATLLSATASAVTITQQNLIPETDKSEFIGQAGLQVLSASREDDSDVAGVGFGLGLSYYYGFIENNAIGVSTNYFAQGTKVKKSGNPDQDTKEKGLENVTFLYKGNYSLGTPTLFFHGGFSLPVGPLKLESSGNTVDASTSEGQRALIGTLGIVVPVGTLELGALTTYQKKAEGKVEINSSGTTTDYDSKGGDEFGASIFAELTGDLNLNFSLNYLNHQDITYAEGNTNGTFAGTELLSAAAGMRSAVNESTEIIGTAELSSMLNQSKRDLKGYAQIDVTVGIRLTF